MLEGAVPELFLRLTNFARYQEKKYSQNIVGADRIDSPDMTRVTGGQLPEIC